MLVLFFDPLFRIYLFYCFYIVSSYYFDLFLNYSNILSVLFIAFLLAYTVVINAQTRMFAVVYSLLTCIHLLIPCSSEALNKLLFSSSKTLHIVRLFFMYSTFCRMTIFMIQKKLLHSILMDALPKHLWKGMAFIISEVLIFSNAWWIFITESKILIANGQNKLRAFPQKCSL